MSNVPTTLALAVVVPDKPGDLSARPRAKWRILIADDDENCRALLETALRTPDTEVIAACDGGELLACVADNGPFDLIVTDIDMPWMHGLQVVASMRQAELSTPVLVITGMTSPNLPAAVANLGRSSILFKPINIAEVRNAIAALQALTTDRD